MVPWLLITIPILAIAVQTQKERLNLLLMGIFRDVGRFKAHRRRHKGDNNKVALVQVLFKREDPLMGIDFENEDELVNVPTFTLEELWEFGQGDGSDEEDTPHKLLLSVFGRIYDVTAGEKFYGPHSRYHMFPGRDVTYALGSGCKTDECLEKSVEDLSEKQMKEALRWLSYFQLHDKYPFVGKLEDNPLEELMDAWVEEAVAQQKESGEEVVMPKMF